MFEEDVKSGVRDGLSVDGLREEGDADVTEGNGDKPLKKRGQKRGE